MIELALASHFAALALKCVHQEYPNKPDHVLNDAADARTPQAMHPAFYGCYDWHSCVHAHWLLARLLRERPDLPEATAIRKVFDETFTPANIAAEKAYLDEKERKTFERTYGWAWLLKLDAELRAFKGDPQAARWAAALDPLARALAARYKDFLPKQTYPIRTGVHPNTAFGLSFALDWARAAGDRELEALLIERSRFYYLADKNAPASWEPGGEDFFSPSLMEADLMRRVLDPKPFAAWFQGFLPALPKSLQQPAVVGDRSDPKLVHLDGLNLSRAAAMRAVAAALPTEDPARAALVAAAAKHLDDALPHVASGDYAGEHWLATFAVLALSAPVPTK
jgi:hypothetical protein